jgi:hypothetical protein
LFALFVTVMAAGPVSGAFGTVTQRVWPPETPQVVDACATPEPMVIIEASKASITKNRTMKGRVLGFCTCHLSRFERSTTSYSAATFDQGRIGELLHPTTTR